MKGASPHWTTPAPRLLFRLVAAAYERRAHVEVGMRKPNPDIFAHALELLDVRPERVAFVDDAEPNTDGAVWLGMHTVLHTDPDNTRKKLVRLVPALEAHISQHKEKP